MPKDGRLDPTSRTWEAIAEWAANEITACQAMLEQEAPHEKTQHLRGRIYQLRQLLKLAEPDDTPVLAEPIDYFS